jgi:hypothetical protein
MRARTVLVGLLGVAYVVGCHWLMTSAPRLALERPARDRADARLVALFAARRGQRLVAGLAALVLAGLVLQAWQGGGLAPATLYLAQHVAIHASLALLFALTLRPGQEPLVTALARRVHGVLTPRDAGLFAQGDDRLERLLRADGRDLGRPLPGGAVRGLGSVRQPPGRRWRCC